MTTNNADIIVTLLESICAEYRSAADGLYGRLAPVGRTSDVIARMSDDDRKIFRSYEDRFLTLGKASSLSGGSLRDDLVVLWGWMVIPREQRDCWEGPAITSETHLLGIMLALGHEFTGASRETFVNAIDEGVESSIEALIAGVPLADVLAR